MAEPRSASISLSRKVTQVVNDYLATVPRRSPTNAEAMEYIKAHRNLRPVFNAREAQWVNNLVALGRTNEANQIISESRIRTAKERMLTDGFEKVLRNAVIEELIIEAIQARKEKARQ